MARDKAKDDKYFNCSEEHELSYVCSLYADSKVVRQYLVRHCKLGNIKYRTHMQIYILIFHDLGFRIPSE